VRSWRSSLCPGTGISPFAKSVDGKNLRRVVKFLLPLLALAACSTSGPANPVVTHIPQAELDNLVPPKTPPATVVGVDDLLEVTFLKQYPNDRSAYKFDVGDVLELQFYTRPEPPQSYSVQPDGRIYLPEIGYLMVRGFTAGEIETRLRKAYAQTRLAGPVNVVARTTDAKVNEMIATLGRSNTGPTRDLRVLPDGTITLPLLDLVPVGGHSLAAVQADINDRYARLFNDLHVSVELKESSARRYSVLGEVKSPGVFAFQQGTSLLDALSKAGGVVETGKVFDVLVFRAKPDGVEVTELDAGSDASAIGQLASWQIQPSDLVYVPKSAIADLDQFVKQYIRDLLPVGVSVFYGVQ